MAVAQGIPQAPVVDVKTGMLTPMWWNFFASLLGRTGGAAGFDVTSLAPSTAAPIVLTLGASPFVFTATGRGTLILDGGGVAAVSLTRGGATIAVGNFYAPLTVNPGDTVTVVFPAAPPVAKFLPL